jgi:sugar lactone lactonase YvrE
MRAAVLRRVVLFAAAALAAVQLAAAGPAPQAEIKTENGVRIVRNPASPVKGPGGKVAVVTLIEDLTIGNDTGREDYWFGVLNALDVDASGNIYTVDPKSVRIRIFGPDGTLIKAFGREGQGPGEFSGPGGLIVAPDGTFIVSDVLNGRLSRFDAKGTFLKDIPFGASRFAGLAIDRRSDFYALQVGAPSGGAMSWELVKLDAQLKPLRKIHAIAVPFKPRTMNLMPERIHFVMAGEDRLAWMASTEYLVHVLDASGQEVLRIRKDHTPRQLTPGDRDRLAKSQFPGGAPAQLQIEYPDAFPAASGLTADEKGRIFVRTYETDDQGRAAVDVFSAEGLYIARFFVPGDLDAMTVKGDKLCGIVKESASGNPLVKRFALGWK